MLVTARRRGTYAATAALAVATLAAPALAGCDKTSAFACGVRHDSVSALPVSATSLSAVLSLRNDNGGLSFAAYDQLVPAGFTSPGGARAVAVQVTRYDLGKCRPTAGNGSAPAAPAPPCSSVPQQSGTTSWIEASVALRVALGDDSGWFPLTAPVSSPSRLQEAQAAGLPAHAATGDVVLSGSNAKATATRAGAPLIDVDFTAGGRVPGDVSALSTGGASVFSVVPALTGSQKWRTSQALSATVPVFDVVPNTPPSDAQQPGLTSTGRQVSGSALVGLGALALPGGRTLADLVAPEQVVPAVLRAEDGLLITKRDNLDDGKAGPVPADAPAAAGVFASAYSAQLTGFLTPFVAVTVGSTGHYANADATAHTVTARQNGPDGKPLFEGYATAAEVVEVEGVERLPRGTYDFLCALHPEMRGQLVVS